MLLTGMILGIPIIMSSKPSPLKSPALELVESVGSLLGIVIPIDYS